MTTYAYIRVSSDKQTVEIQRDMIKARGYSIDCWLCDEATSGMTDWKVRDIRNAVQNGMPGDKIIVAELSRLGRSLKQILEIVEECRAKSITILLIREGIEVCDDNPFTKLLVSILGSLAEMERNLISQRTKDGLALKKKQGVVLGRPKGSGVGEHYKLLGKEAAIRKLLRRGYSCSWAADILGVDRMTLFYFCQRNPSLKRILETSKHKNRKLRKSSVKGNPIMCVDLGRVFVSVAEAARETGANESCIALAACGKYKTAGGYRWVMLKR